MRRDSQARRAAISALTLGPDTIERAVLARTHFERQPHPRPCSFGRTAWVASALPLQAWFVCGLPWPYDAHGPLPKLPRGIMVRLFIHDLDHLAVVFCAQTHAGKVE